MQLSTKRVAAPGGGARRALGLLAGIALIVSCTDKGRSLVLVDISLDQTVSAVASVRAVVVQGNAAIGESDANWSTSPAHLGVYLAKTVSGAVQVLACGFNASGGGIATASAMSASVQAGSTAGPVAFTLTPGAPSPLCGSGTSGTGGAGGSAVGTGGSTGGSVGSGGAGGQLGTGGSLPGTGGANGGSSGTGGAGTGGVGGSGTGGAKGGSSGTGGTGTGGTGTGGSSGPSWSNAVGVGGPATITQVNPSVAVDPNGSAVVVYQYSTGIYANHYDAAQNTWGTPAPLDTRATAYEPKVVVDKNGIYVAVWGIPNDATYMGIWQSSSSDGVNWSKPASITTTNAFGPVISMNANGDAVAAWTESVGGNWQAAASLRAGSTQKWGTPQVMLASADNGDRNPAAAISGTGEAFVGWEQSDGGANDISSVWMRHYAGGSWGAAALFDDDLATASTISIAANKSGSAIVTYVELTPTFTLKLWSRWYAPTTNFSPALMVAEENDIDETIPPALVLDDSGVATVAWNTQVGNAWEVHASRSAAGDPAWPAETALETDDTAAQDDPDSSIAQATMPLLGCDPAGNVTLIWRKRTTASGLRFDLYSRRFVAGGTWNPPGLIESMDPNSVFWPALAVGADGTAVAAWYYSTDTSSSAAVWANIFR
jgi:hypothetical protein